uniref:Uncharacterized protein n=1 Tax=Chaetoceros debilis TaxID=122233 RepID=A0A7S3PZY6_9STRA|mmetsp:Transcript_20642/g.31345  ORF Transcript_20642/g.31345 Transcript_20642/m.31345 type:complete len:229 (-) Transcript_20642:42-728(-)
MPKVSKASRKKAKVAAAGTGAATGPLVDSLKQSKTELKKKEQQQQQKDDEADDAENQAMSRGQRKRLAKREQYLRREKMVMSTLKLKTLEEQKGRLDGLDAIKDALTATIVNKGRKSSAGAGADDTKTSQENEVTKTNKAKKDLAQKELTHMKLVLQHPTFQSNPFATMQQHLKNTLVQSAERQEILAKQDREKYAKEAEEKKEARKERIRDAKYEKGRKGYNRRRRN